MSLSESAPTLRAASDPITFTFDDRHWRVRGLESELSCQRLRVNLLVSRRELTHIDTVDLYSSRQRRMFLREAAAELYVEEGVLKRDLGRVLLELERRQERLIKENLLEHQQPQVPRMTEQQRDEALQLLKDPQLAKRILSDYEECGLVGEETNKLLCYLAGVSRLLDRPLSVLVQSSSAAGKTSLLEATLALMPPEAQVRMSSLTAQALYYMGTRQLRHKILSVAEEAGVAEAAYALKLLQSDGHLRIATVGKDRGTRRCVTEHYEVEGPVALLLSTTAEHPDTELANRCLVISVNEQPAQTAAIHQRQRASFQPAPTAAGTQKIRARHQNAQRLLQALPVIFPFAEKLTFRSDQTRHRRDHAHYLSLIASIALLHQYQRQQLTCPGGQGSERTAVVATLDDLELANRLMGHVLRSGRQELLPQARQLLAQLTAYVHRQAQQAATLPTAVRFTQRQVREALAWHDRTLRRHLARLVELEYVVALRTGRGNGRVYQLVEPLATAGGAERDFALVQVDRLRPTTARPQDAAIPRCGDSAP